VVTQKENKEKSFWLCITYNLNNKKAPHNCGAFLFMSHCLFKSSLKSSLIFKYLYYMRSTIRFFAFNTLIVIAGLCFTACNKKDNTEPEEPAIVTEDGQTAIDNRSAQSENDIAINDISTEVANNSFLHGKSASGTNALPSSIDYTVDTTGAYTGTIKINYTGATVNNRKRTGAIKLAIQNYPSKKWKDAGCILKVDYLNYKITRPSDGKNIKINGTQNITNESGGSWWELLITKTQSGLITSVAGSYLYVTFDSTKTAVYNINRRFTYTTPGNVLNCQCEGMGSYNGINHLENYGANRDGIIFTSQVINPVIWNWTCGSTAPIKGEMSVKANDRDFTVKVLFGVDANGNPVNVLPNNCPYGWKVEWVNNSLPGKRVFSYL